VIMAESFACRPHSLGFLPTVLRAQLLMQDQQRKDPIRKITFTAARCFLKVGEEVVLQRQKSFLCFASRQRLSAYSTFSTIDYRAVLIPENESWRASDVTTRCMSPIKLSSYARRRSKD